ncbi:BatA domain-containing protein, partial [Myxococcota bacterium]|nr:BatA domain-containing protein [Myxococcota bacterium]
MALLTPWALWALAAVIPALIWLHLGARPKGDQPFSAFFLLRRATLEGAGAARLRAPLLLAARLAATLALIIALAGPYLRGEGTLVLAAGPLPQPRPDAWSAPLTVVRAGRPPRLDEAPAPVLGPPSWSSALLLGRQHAPHATVARVPPLKAPTG